MLYYNFYEGPESSSQLLVLLHGFISDQTTYEPFIEGFTKHCHVLAVDLPGHGQDESDANETWDFPFIADSLDETLAQFERYDIYLQGYSMGGRIALYYALYGKIALTGLILESTSPGIQSEADREERQKVDLARAKVLEIAGLEVFVNDWEKLPPFYTQKQLPKAQQRAIREQRLSQQPERLAKALKDYGTGFMPDMWPQLPQLKVPTLLMTGALDQKFTRIANQMIKEIPDAQLEQIPDCGHTIHVEDASRFDKMVLSFIN